MLSKVHSFLEALFVYLVILNLSGGFRLLRFFCGVVSHSGDLYVYKFNF